MITIQNFWFGKKYIIQITKQFLYIYTMYIRPNQIRKNYTIFIYIINSCELTHSSSDLI